MQNARASDAGLVSGGTPAKALVCQPVGCLTIIGTVICVPAMPLAAQALHPDSNTAASVASVPGGLHTEINNK